MTKLKLVFSPPESGWLPVRLLVGGLELSLSVSRVPQDVIAQLFDAVASTAAGRGGAVWWHEEPGGHQMQLSTLEDGRVQLQLWQRRHPADRPGRELADICGSREEILLPLWRALSDFASVAPAERNWTAYPYDDFRARVAQLCAVIVAAV